MISARPLDGVQSGELLIDSHRVVRAQHGDRAPELDPLRNRRGRRENHRARGGRHLRRVVFANTEVVEPYGIGQGDGLAQIAHGVGRRSEGAAIRIPLDIGKAENTEFHAVVSLATRCGPLLHRVLIRSPTLQSPASRAC